MQKVGKEDEPIKLDNSVWQYHVLEQNKVLYIKSGNNTLYINDKKGNKEKIASHVEKDYHIDKDEKNIVWIEAEDGVYAIYQQDLALKREKKALATNINFYDISENLKQIAVVEEDTLYVIRNFDDKKENRLSMFQALFLIQSRQAVFAILRSLIGYLQELIL